MSSASRVALLSAAAAFTLVGLAGCGPVKLIANTNIPTPLVVKMPIAVALFVPQEFSSYVHKEERWSTDWNIELGKTQTESLMRLMNAMFDRVVQVDSVSAGSALGGDIRAILEPSIEEYAFVTPRDAGSPFFAVSIKYRVNVYTPEGKLADSWGFTGYGTSPAQGLSSTSPLAAATALALRDAGAKLAVEFREQGVLRGLLPDSATADTLPGPPVQPIPVPAPGAAQETPAPPAASSDPAAAPVATPPSEQPEAEGEDESGEKPPAPVQPQAFVGPIASALPASFLQDRLSSASLLRVLKISRFVMPVVATGSPFTNFGR